MGWQSYRLAVSKALLLSHLFAGFKEGNQVIELL